MKEKGGKKRKRGGKRGIKEEKVEKRGKISYKRETMRGKRWNKGEEGKRGWKWKKGEEGKHR